MRVTVPTINANLASEYHVASLLFRKGYVVTVTFGNTKEVDLIVLRPRDKRKVTIDVKGLKNRTNWPMPRHPLVRNDHFFCLVCFNNQIQNLEVKPEVFVVPSRHVRKLWKPWSGRPNQKGIPYKIVKDSAYKGNWGLLFADAR